MSDSVRNRLWIASPYVGSWSIRSVIGRAWWDRDNIDVRLLTDPDEGQINRETALRFAEKGKIKKLRGLHAKLFIVDNEVLLTSANLTFCAFARRHEAGLVLKGEIAKSAITLFETWWSKAEDVEKESILRLPRKQLATAGEDGKPGLPEAGALPPDPGNFGGQKFIALFGDYPEFLHCYQRMVNVYKSLPRAWPELPLYLETDAFLAYLYLSSSAGRPAKKFTKSDPRPLTRKQQESEIHLWARRFRSWAQAQEADRKRRLSTSRLFRRVLSPSNIGHLDRIAIADVASKLNCFNDKRYLGRFLNSRKNTTAKIRQNWGTLLHTHRTSPTEEMTQCASLYGFKRSSVQELLGWYRPNEFPLRNRSVNAGLRFLGYNVRPT